MFIGQGKQAIDFSTTGGYVLIWLLIAGVFLIDLAVPNGVAVPMLYVLPLALTAWMRTRAVVIAAAGACLGLAFLGFVLSSSSELGSPGYYNRALSMIVLAGCTYMALVNQGHRRKIMEAYHERCRGEEDFKQLGAVLEQRVEERTAELQAARRAALNILDDTEWARRRAEQAEAEVRVAHAALEQRVEIRTTELAQANVQLKQTSVERGDAEEQFRLVVESAPCGLVMIDETGAMLLVNPELERQFGYSKLELIGQRIELLIPERFRKQHPAHRQSFNRVPTARAMGAGRDLYGLRKDGSEFSVEIALNPVDTSSGSRTLAIVVDISERRRVERQSRLSEFAVNHSSMPTLWIAPDGKVFRVNQATCNMMGYTEEELLQMTLSDLNPEFPADKWTTYWQELKEKQYITYESSLRHKEGHMFPVEVRSNFLEFEGQEFNVKFVADISDRKRAEEYSAQQNAELGRSNSELEQFAYVASHDLQEPLRMVSSYCGLLARRYKGKLGEDADEYIHFAVDGATRMKYLIDDLLLYSRVGRRDKPFTPINSTDSLRTALENLGIAIEAAHAVITCDPLPTVFADPIQLTQVFQNLIGNALKFKGDQDSRVHVSAQCSSESNDPSQWVFSIQDNGIGFEQQFDDRVFVIFQRLHTREQYSGNGMGLAITKKIIERHGGRIWVESKPGAGSTFFFTLRGQPSDSLCVAASGVEESK